MNKRKQETRVVEVGNKERLDLTGLWKDKHVFFE